MQSNTVAQTNQQAGTEWRSSPLLKTPTESARSGEKATQEQEKRKKIRDKIERDGNSCHMGATKTQISFPKRSHSGRMQANAINSPTTCQVAGHSAVY